MDWTLSHERLTIDGNSDAGINTNIHDVLRLSSMY